MKECICNSCKNLRGIIDDNGKVKEYECEYGYPSENCVDCEVEECELTCDHYICDEEESIIISSCKGCGKELQISCENEQEGEVYCFDCYLNK